MMQVGLEFGALLERIWLDLGPKLGAKLEPSWHQNQKKLDTEKSSKDDQKKVTQLRQTGWVLAPNNLFGISNPEVQRVQGPIDTLETLHFVPQGHGGGSLFWRWDFIFQMSRFFFDYKLFPGLSTFGRTFNVWPESRTFEAFRKPPPVKRHILSPGTHPRFRSDVHIPLTQVI